MTRKFEPTVEVSIEPNKWHHLLCIPADVVRVSLDDDEPILKVTSRSVFLDGEKV